MDSELIFTFLKTSWALKLYFLLWFQDNKDGFKEAIKEKLPELSDEEKENVVTSIINHFENPAPVPSPPPKGNRKYGGRFRRRSSSSKDNRKSLSDKETEHCPQSPTPIEHAMNGLKVKEENLQVEITQSHENGDNNWLKTKV